MSDSPKISLTANVARQTPKNEFGSVLKNTLDQAGKVGGMVSGALLGGMPGGPILSAAANSVSNLLNSTPNNVSSVGRAATGIQTVGGGGSVSGGGQGVDRLASAGTGELPSGLNGMIDQMRTEADRSMMMQMNMQSESREYNALSNVLKTRHDSAKAAINNIR
jgi:hypothetical protein